MTWQRRINDLAIPEPRRFVTWVLGLGFRVYIMILGLYTHMIGCILGYILILVLHTHVIRYILGYIMISGLYIIGYILGYIIICSLYTHIRVSKWI